MSDWLDGKIKELTDKWEMEQQQTIKNKQLKAIEAERRKLVRLKDRAWFNYHLGEWMKDKEIHHLWKDGDRCLILGKQQHRDLHKGPGGHS